MSRITRNYQTVREVLEAKSCQCLDKEVAHTIVNYKNNAKVLFQLPCGHRKTLQAQYLSKSGWDENCGDCVLQEKYGYDSLEGTLTCKSCGGVSYEVPRTNLKKFPCLHCCERVTPETEFFRNFNELKIADCYITRNCQYDGDFPKALTADFKIVWHDRQLLVEIDEDSHLSRAGSERHLKKQDLAREMGVPLLRLRREDVDRIGNVELWDDIFHEAFTCPRSGVLLFTPTKKSLEFYQHHRISGEVLQDDDIPPNLTLLEHPKWLWEEDDEETEARDYFLDQLQELSPDIVNRVEDLYAFKREIENNPEDKRNEDLDVFIETWDKLSLLITHVQSAEVLEAIKLFLNNLTSLLLFQGRKLTLEEHQSVKEIDVERTEDNPFTQ